jgi:hypothetical protein
VIIRLDNYLITKKSIAPIRKISALLLVLMVLVATVSAETYTDNQSQKSGFFGTIGNWIENHPWQTAGIILAAVAVVGAGIYAYNSWTDVGGAQEATYLDDSSGEMTVFSPDDNMEMTEFVADDAAGDNLEMTEFVADDAAGDNLEMVQELPGEDFDEEGLEHSPDGHVRMVTGLLDELLNRDII